MFYVLLVILILVSLVLMIAILAQSGKGTGLAANFGGASSSPDAFIGVRQAGNLLTKISWWGGGLFLALAFILQIMSTRTRGPKSVLEKSFSTPAPSAPAPQSAAPAPAVPLEPAAGASSPAAPPAAPTSPATPAPAP